MSQPNPYLTGPLGPIYAKTALPIIFVMGTNGLLAVADVGALFVSAPGVVAQVERILPLLSAGFCAAGPLMMIAMHFQAIGDARRAAILGLSKPYLFAIPLTFVLPGAVGEPGVWLAAPLAEILLLGLTALTLSQVARQRALRWGLFHSGQEVRP